MKKTYEQRTVLAAAAVNCDAGHGAVMPPLHLSSNFAFGELGEEPRYDYTRSGNPTRDNLAVALARAEVGAGAVITSSGMSAVHLSLIFVPPGGTIIAPEDCYGGTYRLLEALEKRQAFHVEFIDQSVPDQMARITDIRPDLVLVESPTNPLMRVVDIGQIAQIAKSVDARLIVDNTFLSPALQQPISLGADIVVHSTTKYINGHSDVVGGAVIAASPADFDELAWWANCTGVAGAPFDSYMTLRGLRTLHARIDVQQRTAGQVAEYLERHPAVSRVYYPGLVSHPGHELACRQQKGFGAMLSLELAGGYEGARRFVDGLELFTLAESLGGVESLIAHPASMTHKAMNIAARQRAGIGDGLLRLSIGLEATSDLIADLGTALNCVAGSTRDIARAGLGS